MATKLMTTRQLNIAIKRLRQLLKAAGTGSWSDKSENLVRAGTGRKTLLEGHRTRTGRWKVKTSY